MAAHTPQAQHPGHTKALHRHSRRRSIYSSLSKIKVLHTRNTFPLFSPCRQGQGRAPPASSARPVRRRCAAGRSAAPARTRHPLAGGMSDPALPVGRAGATPPGSRLEAHAPHHGQMPSASACRTPARSPAPPERCWRRPSHADGPCAPSRQRPAGPAAPSPLRARGSRQRRADGPRRAGRAGLWHPGPGRARLACGAHARGAPPSACLPAARAPGGRREGRGQQRHRGLPGGGASQTPRRQGVAPPRALLRRGPPLKV